MDHPAFAAANLALARYKQLYERQGDDVSYLPGAAYLDFQRELAARVSGRICHVLPITSEQWDANNFANVIWRQAAGGVLSLERIYILPHRGFGGASYEQQITQDTAAGISTTALVVSELSPALESLQLNEFWLLNDDGVVIVNRDAINIGQTIVTVSLRSTDIEQCSEKWQRLAELSLQSAPAQNQLNLQEPLVSSADLLSDVSSVLCSSDHIDPKTCEWYHSVWQFLRLVDLVSTPSWHNDFYHARLVESLSAAQMPAVLISGTADYSMLAYVISAASTANRTAAITVVDLCATPLFACRWYAQRAKQLLVTVQDDVTTSPLLKPETFDLICSDAFLTRFSNQEVEGVLRRWSHLLKPAGHIVTTIRLHPRGASFDDFEEAVQRFASSAAARIERWKPFLRTPTETIVSRSMVYARCMRSNNHGDVADVTRLFTRSALEIVHSELANVPGELAPSVYLRIYAKRKS